MSARGGNVPQIISLNRGKAQHVACVPSSLRMVLNVSGSTVDYSDNDGVVVKDDGGVVQCL